MRASGWIKVVSIDKDFDVYRDARGKYLVNLLLSA